jgi:hypothetical protein
MFRGKSIVSMFRLDDFYLKMESTDSTEMLASELYRLHLVVYKILDYLYYNRQHNTLLIYNLLLFINIATCFEHNFGHHQAFK